MTQTKHVTKGMDRYRYDAGKAFYLPLNIANQFIQEGSAMEDKSLDEAPETKKKQRKKKIV
jgi:hypothetical protein